MKYTRRPAVVLAAAAFAVHLSAGPLLASPSGDTATGHPVTVGQDPPPPPEEGQLTWGVVPANAEGQPDNRVSFRLEVEPGGTVTEHALVTNYSSTPVTFDIRGSDGVISEDGAFDVLPPDDEQKDIGTWIEVQQAAEVPAGGSALIPFTITVPANATPGDHPGGIVAGISRTSEEEGGPQVGMNARVGVRIHMRVAGEVEPVVTISDVNTSYDASLNPFSAGTLTVTYTVTNEGNIRLGSIQEGEVDGLFGLPSGAEGPRGAVIGDQRELLPGDSVTVTEVLEDTWPMGRLSTEVTGYQDPVGEDPGLGELDPVSASASVWAIPWPQLVVLLLVLLVIAGLIRRRARRRGRVEQAIADAKAEGAKEAGASRNGKSTGKETSLSSSSDS
jgi:hypothetical protein